VASLSQGRTAAAQCGLFTYKSVPVIFEPPCIFVLRTIFENERRQERFPSMTNHDLSKNVCLIKILSAFHQITLSPKP